MSQRFLPFGSGFSASINRSIASRTVTASDHFLAFATSFSASLISGGTRTLTATILLFPVAIATALPYQHPSNNTRV